MTLYRDRVILFSFAFKTICLQNFFSFSAKSTCAEGIILSTEIPMQPEPAKISRQEMEALRRSLIAFSTQYSVSTRGMRGLYRKSILQFKKGFHPIR